MDKKESGVCDGNGGQALKDFVPSLARKHFVFSFYTHVFPYFC